MFDNGSPMSGDAAEISPRPARSPLDADNGAAASRPAAPATKPRSCVVCRSRKVRCDKKSPCSNCRRANIPCIRPSSASQTPRWAKNYNAAAGERSVHALDSTTTQLMDRLRNLETLVKDLRGQLDQAHLSLTTSNSGSPADSNHDRDGRQETESPTPSAGKIQSHFGRLVISDASRSRYMSTGFWSRVNDELDEIRTETHDLAETGYDSSEEDEGPDTSPSTHELQRSPSERHGFLFRHNLSSPGPDTADLHPLPSQVPFLLDIFAENVNLITQIVHMPTIRKMARPERGSDTLQLTPANEALMFSVYYAAITSMEEEDVVTNFRTTKAELNQKFRIGLEYALAKADFLNTLDITLLQAFTTFLFLVRRHDSPRFVWMMTSLAIRMAHGLGLQRDGSHLKNLTPFEVETRRRVWYALCALDVRASEDQGTEFVIQYGAFDTEMTKNINDTDIDINTKEPPKERVGITDSTICIVTMGINNITRQMMLPGNSLEEQRRIIQKIYNMLEERYLRFSHDSGNVIYRGLVLVTRLVVAKLTLLAHLPVLFSSPSEHFSDELRHELFVAALRVAEINHALNSDRAYCQWRWVYQTYTQWHAVVYILLDISRRPWSPLVERAWIKLHSPWLIPAQSKLEKDSRAWVPVRKLVMKARRHRTAERERLRNDPAAARQLEINDQNLPASWIFDAFPCRDAIDESLDGWRMLVGLPHQHPLASHGSPSSIAPDMANMSQAPGGPYPDSRDTTGNAMNSQSVYQPPVGHIPSSATQFQTSMPPAAYDTMALDQSSGWAFNSSGGFAAPISGWPDALLPSDGQAPWLWGDADPNVDAFGDLDMDLLNGNVDMEMDWNNWVEFARDMERDSQAHR